MNEFDELNVNGTEKPNEVSETEAAESKGEKTSDGVVFNADGTYHGKAQVHSGPSENQSQNTENQRSENNSAYPYGNSNGNFGYNPPNNSPYSQQPNQYGNYPYGQGAYPYGNSDDRAQNNNGFSPSSEHYRYAYPEDGGAGKRGKNGSKIFAIVAGVLCVFLIIALIAVVAGDKNPVVPDTENTTAAVSENVEEIVTNSSPITGEMNSVGEMTPKSIFNKVLPSSVGILVYDNSKTLASEGSGVLFQESNDNKYTYIITCAHVISDSSGYIRVQAHDGSEYDADVVGYDARTDIGVIKIEKTGFTLAEIGDSSKIAVGDYVYAIGNPGGVEFANSFTNGIVSALDRPVNSSATGYTTECIQHTAAINPGNSGGALVNSFGQVVGINSMKIVADEYEGMGFAVPSSVFVEIVNEIMEHGYVSNRPKLGITYVAATEYSSYGMFVAIKGLPSGSIVIHEISSDSSLVGTDVKKGDMIYAVNGKDLDDPSYLSELIEESNVGDKLTLSIIRIHEDYTFDDFKVTVTLVEDRGDTMIQQEEEEETLPGTYPGGGYDDYFGKYFEDYFNDFFGGFAP
ncbi:MAG: trypsin-like peptidase domain-containing protein [Clostridia bacterium]|nr:trypsin-like peptidase domain-containing protein [Clostridia bacterium]